MSGLGKLTNRRGGGEENQYCRVNHDDQPTSRKTREQRNFQRGGEKKESGTLAAF